MSTAQESTAEESLGRTLLWIGWKALLYAGAVTLLVLFWPSEPHVFIYQGF